jgi:CubicO group peptidase (beta-lactamase class C family)
MIRRLTFLAVMLTVGAPAAHGQNAAPLPAFDQYVTRAVRDWRAQGLAVALVHGDTITFAKGYGYRTLGRPERVDEHTLFAIGSTTKAMTAMLMGMLVDSGLVGWDDPVVSHMAGFRIADPYVTSQITIRDLLTHRAGLPNTDFLWNDTAATYADMLRRFPFIPLGYSMRSQFVYQNVMYATAGHVEGLLTGSSWDDLIKRRIFGPLGMNETVTSTRQLPAGGDVATPHARVNDTLIAIPWRNLDAVGPAGSVNSSVSDMARWIRALLDSGRVGSGGKRLVSAPTFSALFTPQAIVPNDFYPAWSEIKPHVVTYGMGWFLFDYQGHRVAMHTGSIDGMSAIVGLLPDDRVGVVVLENQDHVELRHALLLKAFDMYLGSSTRDWSADLLKVYSRVERQADSASRAQEGSRVPGVKPALPLERYAGTYTDSLYGKMTLRVEQGRLVAQNGPWLADVEAWSYDTFRFRWRRWSRGTELVTCDLTPNGTVAQLHFGDGSSYTRESSAK